MHNALDQLGMSRVSNAPALHYWESGVGAATPQTDGYTRSDRVLMMLFVSASAALEIFFLVRAAAIVSK